MKVEVYWNLHKHCYSVRHKGKVIAHVPFITLKDVQWVVQPAGRKRVLRERRKNVHAFARGTWLKGNDELELVNNQRQLTHRMPITYNPYRHHKFVLRQCPDVQIEWSDYAKLHSVYRVIFDDYKPKTYIYNFREPMQHDPDWDRYDQGPRI
jgi:hypothetical protein